MPIRQIVHIDEELCDGCGLCVTPCAEGAIQLIDGKARVVSDDLCDGAGFCLGVCPPGALTIEEREAGPLDERKAGDPFAVPLKGSKPVGVHALPTVADPRLIRVAGAQRAPAAPISSTFDHDLKP